MKSKEIGQFSADKLAYLDSEFNSIRLIEIFGCGFQAKRVLGGINAILCFSKVFPENNLNSLIKAETHGKEVRKGPSYPRTELQTGEEAPVEGSARNLGTPETALA